MINKKNDINSEIKDIQTLIKIYIYIYKLVNSTDIKNNILKHFG